MGELARGDAPNANVIGINTCKLGKWPITSAVALRHEYQLTSATKAAVLTLWRLREQQ